MDNEEIRRRLAPVVVGGDILAYSYVRELHRAYGIDRTIVLATQDIKMLSKSRFSDYRLVPGIHDPEHLYAALESVAEEVRASRPDALLLVLGCDDCHARMLSSGKERLAAAGYTVPYIDFDLLDEITQKRRFYELCEELDIPYPKTWYFDCGCGPDTLPMEEFSFPLIAKPSNSAQFQDATIAHKRKIYEIQSAEELAQVWDSIRRSDYDNLLVIAKPSNSAQFQDATIAHKRKIYEIQSAEELAQVWDSIRRSDYDNLLVIQDFVPGDDAAIRTLTTFSDAAGEVRVVSGGVVCLQDHDPTALGNPLAIKGEREEAIVECAKRFLRRVGYRGFANFDIKYDKRDGSFRCSAIRWLSRESARRLSWNAPSAFCVAWDTGDLRTSTSSTTNATAASGSSR